MAVKDAQGDAVQGSDTTMLSEVIQQVTKRYLKSYK